MLVGSEDATTIRNNEFLANVSDRDGDGVAARLLIQDTFTGDNPASEDGQGDTSDYTIEGNYFPNSRYALQQFADLGNDQDISTVLGANTFGEAVTADDPDEDETAGEDDMLPGIWADIEPAVEAAEADANADETVNVVRAGYYENFTVSEGGLAAVDAVDGAVIDEWPDEKDPGVHIDGATDVTIEGFEIRDQEHGVLVNNGASGVDLVDLDVHDNNNTGIQITGTSTATGYSTSDVSVIGGQVYDNGEHFYNNGDVVNDTENVDDGINASFAQDVTVDGTEVFGNENDNIGFRSVQNGVVTGATIYDAGSGAVPLTAPNNDPADDGVQVSDFNPHSYYILVNGTNFYDNPNAGVNVVSFTDLGLGTPIDDTFTIAGFDDPGFVVTYNNFEDQETDIINQDGKLVEARMNWFGDGGGNPNTVNVHPTGNHPDTPMTQEANIENPDGSVVTGEADDTVVYDPFLTAPPSEVKFNASNTQQYGHDVAIEAVDTNSEGPQVVGFPGPTGQNFSQIFSRVNDSDVAPDTMIWAYDAVNDEWVDPATLSDQQADSLDAIAVTRLNKTVAVPIDFADDGGTPGAIQVKRVEPGFNLIASPGHLQAEDAMAVENAGGIERVQNGVLEEPESQPRTTNGIERTFVYNEDTGDNDLFDGRGPTLSPYTGYWVFAESGGDVAPRMTAGYRFQDEFRSLDYDDVQAGAGGGA
jgi:hypothetical protein